MSPTHERVREALSYNPETGVFTWLVRASTKIRVGDVAGSSAEGYWRIKLDGKTYRAHQLAWLYMTGAWPTHEVDHINGVRDDNRWVNLRDVPRLTNQWNTVAPQRSSTTGVRGVERSKDGWTARIRVNGCRKYLGRFATIEEASAAYWAAKAEYHGVETYQARLDQVSA